MSVWQVIFSHVFWRYTQQMDEQVTSPVLFYTTPVILVGGGDIDAHRLKIWAERYPVIGVDSGADEVRAHGIEPEVITGDMDSISSPDAFPQSRILPTPDQDRTDFEKALALIEAPLILCLGFLGRRFDHELAAMNTLARAAQRRIVLIGTHDAIIFIRGDISVSLAAGTRVSVWPVGEQHFIGSDGLEWPLDGLCMAPGKTIGTSNRVAAGSSEVSIRADGEDSGYLIIVPAGDAESLIRSVAPEIR